eukprot:TRINITY_DN5947_c0_g1_i3.p2 TRINITY_DN5947_c0_g1~~TRINITY_DN5947_c0_g1_i3.p2  ORF type:complete len:119 (+),score=29.82 TRINITY_DN5947_c0_g1_i3:53-358(+)
MGRPEDALVCFEEAIQRNPTDADVRIAKGNLLHAMGRPADALVCCDEAIQLNPTHMDAHMNKGILLEDREPWAVKRIVVSAPTTTMKELSILELFGRSLCG